MKNIIEALLIATDVPLPLDKICEITQQPADEVRCLIEELNRDYRETNRSFEIKEIAGGFQIYTLPQYAEWIVTLHKKKERLSRAALETLAIIAYHQPVTRAQIEQARGVDSSWILESLMVKGLIKTCGRLEAPGRPIKYGTTKEFLRYFALKDLSDLPEEEKFVLNIDAEGSDAKETTVSETASVPPSGASSEPPDNRTGPEEQAGQAEEGSFSPEDVFESTEHTEPDSVPPERGEELKPDDDQQE